MACGGSQPTSQEPTSEGDSPARLVGAAAGWNVLLLTVDTVRADRLGAYGYTVRETSPRIDRLLASGVTFERATAQRALTWPSLASVLTGLYPSGHGVVENGYELPPDLPTLPLELHRAGYTTGAFLSNMCHAGHRGWDAFSCSGGRDGKTLRAALDWIAGLDAGAGEPSAGEPQSGDAASGKNAPGNPAGRPREQPYFLWVHYFGAHAPYYNGGDLAATQFDPGYQGPIAPKKGRLDRVITEELELDEADLRHLDALYDAAVVGTDHLVAELLDGLEKMGRLERTLIVFLADHGEELYQHNGYLYHACSVYESTLHVPLGFSGLPGLPAGGRVSQPVELIDVAPTVYELLGLPAPGELHGVSRVPLLARPDAGGRGRPAFSEYGNAPIFTVLFDGWKLVHNPEDIDPYCFPGAPEGHYPLEPTELYDLTADPGETRNLAADEPARVRKMREMIRERFAGLTRRGGEQELPEELEKQLEALGYVAQ
jgi:arylsulfatase A-like enzyme